MAKAHATIIPVTLFQQNCTLLWCPQIMEAVVVDPGGDLERVRQAIASAKVKVAKIWLTHGHIDHAGGAAELAEELGVPIEGPHQADAPLLAHLVESGRAYGMEAVRDVTPDRFLGDGDRVEIGTLAFDILHCPGHSPGSIVFFNPEQRFALVGDVLFRGSVGRTDLPGGDTDTLMRSIRDKLLPLGDDVAFICGHGPTSSIGHERATNPFVNQRVGS